MNAAKLYGRIYTPQYLVKLMLDYVGYVNFENILCKHIIDNSCGDGAFLVEVVRRYCNAHLSAGGLLEDLKQNLATYIHGIEIDPQECEACRQNLDSAVEIFGLTNICWDVICEDTLATSRYNGKMDYVVGNPPYVRVHNLSNSTYRHVKKYTFAQGGMTDLFVVFFEIGFRMMSPTGKMCLITPNSWLNSVAGNTLRSHLTRSKQLNGVIDLEHHQAFKATTYSLISRFSQTPCEQIEYNVFDENILGKSYRCHIALDEMNIGGLFYLAESQTLQRLKEIRTMPHPQNVRVKNGFATLADNVFIGDLDFSGMTIDVIKSSTGKWSKCLFPYSNSKPIPLDDIQQQFPDVYEYFMSKKRILCKGSKLPESTPQQDLFEMQYPADKQGSSWHLFGRTQAINDVAKDKIAINSVIKDKGSIKLSFVPKGKGVYGGLYMLSAVSFEKIQELVSSEEYVSYIATLKNYKSGGYYTCTAKDIELYLNYKLQNNE